jgi:nucleoside-diphosphate-sugar epimerase
VTREKLQTVTIDRAYRIDRMRALLDWEPPTSYEQGLRLTASTLAGTGP